MRQLLLPLLILLGLLAAARPAVAQGVLIPSDTNVAPLALVGHEVKVELDDQVALTHVAQTFHNPTGRPLEATYIFPVPKGASVRKFTMWVGDKEVTGELVEADKARTVYTDIVRRMQDPALLEYLGNNLLKLRVFPVPANGDQKVTLSYTSIADQDSGLIEYAYPLKAQGGNTGAKNFSIQGTLKSQHRLQNVYSPTHPIALERTNDHEAHFSFHKDQLPADHDFQLYYTLGDKDIGLTAVTHRPMHGEDGHVMLLISPRAELAREHQIHRDMVFVLDTSGSMAGEKMEQARKALKVCLNNLDREDSFALMNFATTVNQYSDHLLPASKDQLAHARKWVENLQATGGTAIEAALDAALAMRPADHSRPFTIVFFTDGTPTVGQTDPEQILKTVSAKNSSNTRIFTFGVGDDVNAAFLDRLADQTRAVSTYVRPAEDIEVKVSGLYAKISHPVLTDLKLTTGSNVTLSEVYPTQLPDLFHGSQLVVLARYHGKGAATVTLTGKVGAESKEFVYETTFPGHTSDEHAFVEDLWARRKVGYLLDQIRTNGEKKELVDEVVALAKKFGITTPYTSYLVVPDTVAPATRTTTLGTTSTPGYTFNNASGPVGAATLAPRDLSHGYAIQPGGLPMSAPVPPVVNYAAQMPALRTPVASYESAGGISAQSGSLAQSALEQQQTMARVRDALNQKQSADAQTGAVGVDLALHLDNLRNQNQVERRATQHANGRSCVQVGSVWVDEGFGEKMPTLIVKAQSDAYFQILAKHPEMKDVFRLGNYLVWVTPNQTALVISQSEGKDKLTDGEIDGLFACKK